MSRSVGAPSLSLGPLAIVWGLLCGLAAGGLATVGDPTTYRIGYIAGVALVVFLISLFFGWIAWSANGRREAGGRMTFAIVALLLASGQALFYKYQTSTVGVTVAMQPALDAEATALTMEAQNPALRQAQVEAIVERLAGNLELSTRHLASGPNKDLVLALRGIRRVIARSELTYAAAVYTFIEADVLDLADLKGVNDVRQRERLCQEFAQQNVDYLAYLDQTPQTFAASITDISMNEATRTGVREGFSRTLGAARSRVSAVVAARVEFARHIARLFQHMESAAGRWEIDGDGKVSFQLDADLAQFNAIAGDIDTSQAKLVEVESAGKAPKVPETEATTKVHGAG